MQFNELSYSDELQDVDLLLFLCIAGFLYLYFSAFFSSQFILLLVDLRVLAKKGGGSDKDIIS